MMPNANELPADRLIRFALVAAIIWWSFVLLYPLLGVVAWAVIMAIALYPVFLWLSRVLGDRPIIAASLITFVNLFLVVGAVVLLTNNLMDWVTSMLGKIRAGDQIIPPPPASISQWPFIGEYVYDAWSQATTNLGEEIKAYSSYLLNAGSSALSMAANKTLHLILFIISVLLSGYMMTQGKRAASDVQKFAERLAFSHGSALIRIITDTIKSVAIGIVGVALLQTIIFGVLLLVAGVPGAGPLSCIAFIFCIAQLGLFILVVPITIWLFVSKSIVFASIMTALLILVTLIDNFLKPFALSRGLSTPMLIILIGVIGGVLSYGLIGVFIGPVILAMLHNLFHHWLDNGMYHTNKI